MSEIFNDKNLSRRVVSILGTDPNDDVGYTESDMQRLGNVNAFRAGARGPWTPKPQDPAYREVFESLASIQKELDVLREKIKALRVHRSWTEHISETLNRVETFVRTWRKYFI